MSNCDHEFDGEECEACGIHVSEYVQHLRDELNEARALKVPATTEELLQSRMEAATARTELDDARAQLADAVALANKATAEMKRLGEEWEQVAEAKLSALRHELEHAHAAKQEALESNDKLRHQSLLLHLDRQRAFSIATFGPGDAHDRAPGIIEHITKELREILADPNDLEEWIDVAILAFDGAWRTGASSEEIVAMLLNKQAKNEGRKWPDWRTVPPGKAIEHIRD